MTNPSCIRSACAWAGRRRANADPDETAAKTTRIIHGDTERGADANAAGSALKLIDAKRFAAWMSLARALLNLDEFITRE